MTSASNALFVLFLATALAREQRGGGYGHQQRGSSSDASRQFDLSAEEQTCFSRQRFTDQEMEVLKRLDEELQSGQLSNVGSRDPSSYSDSDRTSVMQKINEAISSMAPSPLVAQDMKRKLQGFLECITQGTQRTQQARGRGTSNSQGTLNSRGTSNSRGTYYSQGTSYSQG